MHGDCASYRSKSTKDVHIVVGSDMTVVSAFAMMVSTSSVHATWEPLLSGSVLRSSSARFADDLNVIVRLHISIQLRKKKKSVCFKNCKYAIVKGHIAAVDE
jgi:hypothetical protein